MQASILPLGAIVGPPWDGVDPQYSKNWAKCISAVWIPSEQLWEYFG